MVNFHPLDFLLRVLETKGEPPGSVKAATAVTPGRSVQPREAPLHAVDAAAERATASKHDGEGAPDAIVNRIGNRGEPAAARPANGAAPSAANIDPASDNAALSLRLSAVARLLGDAAVAANGAAPTVSSSVPLLSQPPPAATELASALQRAIADSGLFYESHLAQWAVRQYPQQQLQAEPQAQWHQAPAAPAGVMADAATVTTATQPNAIAPAPLLRLQLQALITQQVAWHGEAWPGQSASIRIADESPPVPEGIEKTWRTRIELTLPTLGRVHATIGLSGQRLDLTLQSATGESAERLRATAQSLIATLNAREFDVAMVRIGHGDAS